MPISESDYARIPAELGLKRSEIVQVIDDGIHEAIPLTEFANDLLRTPQIQRLKNVAMLGLLNGMTALNTSASRYEHTLGVYKMGLIITRLPELRPYRELQTSVDCGHDAEKAPFDHSTEDEQKVVMGGDHEELVGPRLKDTEAGEVIRRYGVPYEEFADAVCNRHKLSFINEMLHGPFGTDSEGTCRYAMMRHYSGNGLPFNPAAIAYCVKLDDNGQLMLQDSRSFPFDLAIEVRNAVETRKKIFDMIYDPVIEGPEVQVARAAYFARIDGVLGREFFDLTDTEGAHFLLNCESARARTLTENAANNRNYPRVYLGHFKWPFESQVQAICHEPNKQLFADLIAGELGIDPVNVCLNMGRYKGVKDLSKITMLSKTGQPIVPPKVEPYWFAHAYLHPDHADKQVKLAEILDELLLIKGRS